MAAAGSSLGSWSTSLPSKAHLRMDWRSAGKACAIDADAFFTHLGDRQEILHFINDAFLLRDRWYRDRRESQVSQCSRPSTATPRETRLKYVCKTRAQQGHFDIAGIE